VHVQLADEDRACVAQLSHDGRIRLRDPVAEDARARGRAYPRGGKEVLHRDRDAVERAAVAPGGDLALGLARLLARELGRDRDERVQPRERGDAREGRLRDLDW